MRELPFGARISEAFVKKLKWDTALAETEAPGTLPCLCMEEGPWQQPIDEKKAQAIRVDLEHDTEVLPINRVASPASALTASFTAFREILWVLQFNASKYPPEATFEIDGLVLHISKQIQSVLKGAMVHVVSDKIVVTDGRIGPSAF